VWFFELCVREYIKVLIIRFCVVHNWICGRVHGRHGGCVGTSVWVAFVIGLGQYDDAERMMVMGDTGVSATTSSILTTTTTITIAIHIITTFLHRHIRRE
jgi:hypothetical protein